MQFVRPTTRNLFKIYLEGVNTEADLDLIYQNGWLEDVHTNALDFGFLQRVQLWNVNCAVQFIDSDFSGDSLSSAGLDKISLINGTGGVWVDYVELNVTTNPDVKYGTLDAALTRNIPLYLRADTNPTNRDWSREWFWNKDDAFVAGQPSRHAFNAPYTALSELVTWKRAVAERKAHVVCQWYGNKIDDNATQALSFPPAMHLIYQLNDAFIHSMDSASIYSFQTVSGGKLTSDNAAWGNLIGLASGAAGAFRSLVVPVNDLEPRRFMKPV